MVGAQLGKGIGDEAMGGAGEGPDAEAAQLAGRLAHGELCEVGLGQEPLGTLKEHRARWGHLDAASSADKKLALQLVLEVADVLRHRRSGVAKCVRGCRER